MPQERHHSGLISLAHLQGPATYSCEPECEFLMNMDGDVCANKCLCYYTSWGVEIAG